MADRSPEALTYLYQQHGAHFVLCRDKRPLAGFPWRDYAPDLDCVLAHPGNVGIIPFSVGTSALDVDKGDPEAHQFSLFQQPLVIIPSQRPGGLHIYYRDDTPRGNQRWSAFGCSGEVRSAKGYLILHRDAPVRLAHALAYNKDECVFPAGLLDYVEPADVDRLGEVLLDDLDAPGSDQLRLLTLGAPILERVQRGRRNISLFDAVRFWAYEAARRYASYDDWLRAVEIRTLAENRRFPSRLTETPCLVDGVLHSGVDLDGVPQRLRSQLDDGASAGEGREPARRVRYDKPRSGYAGYLSAGSRAERASDQRHGWAEQNGGSSYFATRR